MLAHLRLLVAVILLVPIVAGAAGPDIGLKDMDGKDRNANEFIGKGKWTVVVVWSADCPICKREIYHMTFFHDDHRKKDATVLGLSIDGYENRQKAIGFIQDQSLNFPNLIGGIDEPTRFSGTMFIGTPTYFVFTPEGQFVDQRIGAVTQEQMEAIISRLKAERAKKGSVG